MNKKVLKKPECKLAFKLDRELLDQIKAAALFLDLSVSQLLRRGAIAFIHLHAPEVLPEGKEISVIEPEDLDPSAFRLSKGR